MKTFDRYGIEWPENFPASQVELYMARFHRLPEYQTAEADDPTEHFLRAMRMIFPPSVFRINKWTEQIVHAWCHYEEIVLMGCASANKSHTCGAIALLDWLTAPHVTTTFFCSTTKIALEKRSWASVVSFYSYLKKQGIPAEYSKARMAILNANTDELRAIGVDAPDEVKSGLFAVAAMAGSEQQAVSNFIGVHQPHAMGGVRMFADEAQAVRESFLNARTNLMIGTSDFRIIALGNPMSRTDPLGKLAEPKHGWNTVCVDDEGWDNRSSGRVIHFDGLKSPAIENPEDFPFLISQSHIDRVKSRVRGDLNHPEYLTMVRGWIADSSDIFSVFPVASQRQTRVGEPMDGGFLGPSVALAALDPAFSADGDEAVMVFAWLGRGADGARRLVFDPTPAYLSVDRRETDRVALLDSRCRAALSNLARREIPLSQLGVDESGVQTVGATLALLQQGATAPVSANPYLVMFQQRASDGALSELDPSPVSETFHDRAAEGWSLLERYARFDQIRNLPKDASVQFAARRWAKEKFPRRLESKREYKDREGSSPDCADAVAVLLLMAYHRYNFLPGEGRGSVLSRAVGRGRGNETIEDLAKMEESLNA